MTAIPGATLAGFEMPAPAPMPLLVAGVQPRASGSFNHIAGEVRGGVVTLSDIHAFAWYVGGGWNVRNQKRLLSSRSLNGREDGQCRKID